MQNDARDVLNIDNTYLYKREITLMHILPILCDFYNVYCIIKTLKPIILEKMCLICINNCCTYCIICIIHCFIKCFI